MKVTYDLFVPQHETQVRLVGWGEDYVLLETSGCPECGHTGSIGQVIRSNHNMALLLKEHGIKVVVVANDGSCGDYSRINRLVIREIAVAKEVFSKPAPKNFAEVWERFSVSYSNHSLKGVDEGLHPQVSERIKGYLEKLHKEIIQNC